MNYKTIDQFPIVAGWADRLPEIPISQRQLARRTGDLLRSLGHPVTVHSGIDRDLDKNTIVITAEYDVEKDEAHKKRYIHLTLVTHPKTSKKIKFDKKMSINYALDLVETMCHEYRHEYQFRARDFEDDGIFRSHDKNYEKRQQQEYLGIPGEIDAFAVNIATRMWLLYGKNSLKKLSEGGKLTYESSPDLWGYYDAFGLQHSVCKRVVRKIANNIHKLCEWKPTCQGIATEA